MSQRRRPPTNLSLDPRVRLMLAALAAFEGLPASRIVDRLVAAEARRVGAAPAFQAAKASREAPR